MTNSRQFSATCCSFLLWFKFIYTFLPFIYTFCLLLNLFLLFILFLVFVSTFYLVKIASFHPKLTKLVINQIIYNGLVSELTYGFIFRLNTIFHFYFLKYHYDKFFPSIHWVWFSNFFTRKIISSSKEMLILMLMLL